MTLNELNAALDQRHVTLAATNGQIKAPAGLSPEIYRAIRTHKPLLLDQLTPKPTLVPPSPKTADAPTLADWDTFSETAESLYATHGDKIANLLGDIRPMVDAGLDIRKVTDALRGIQGGQSIQRATKHLKKVMEVKDEQNQQGCP